mmetsp:Transcript_79591/g.251523  ORF Transcript_79591/g.251523 Transcript_79591/m.251523 type:complete len:254 (+) Transcript_79591:35-796(+)
MLPLPPWPCVALASAFFYMLLGRISDQAVNEVLVRRCGVRAVKWFDLRSTVHSMLMGPAAVAAVLYEDMSSDMYWVAQLFACLPASSGLSWILPPVEVGFALAELWIMVPKRDAPYILHGVLVVTSLTLLRHFNVVHFTSRIMVIHVSTIFLNLRGLDLGHSANTCVDIAFVASFIILRFAVLLVWWVQALVYVDPAGGRGCLNEPVMLLIRVVGVLLHGLNFYWGVLILRKLYTRLLSGNIKRAKAGEMHGD